MKARAIAGIDLLGLLLLNACASPTQHYYVLESSAPENVAVSGIRSTVLVGPVAIPAEVDRPQIVVRRGLYEVAFNEQVRWAISLREALPQMIARELGRHVEKTRFVPILSPAHATEKAQLVIEVTHLDLSPESGATVALHWVYRSKVSSLPPVEGDAAAGSPIESQGIEGLLDALRRAMAEAVQTVAKQLPDW